MTTSPSYYYGTGKRKSAIARVRIYPGGSGTIVVNGKPLEEAMPWIDWQQRAQLPFTAIPNAANRFNVVAQIRAAASPPGPMRCAMASRERCFWPIQS